MQWDDVIKSKWKGCGRTWSWPDFTLRCSTESSSALGRYAV